MASSILQARIVLILISLTYTHSFGISIEYSILFGLVPSNYVIVLFFEYVFVDCLKTDS